jgi:hypothetical protein
MNFGPGAAATFLYYFTSTALVITFVMSRSVGSESLSQPISVLGGVVAGGLAVYFNRTTSFTMPVQSRKKFLKSLDATLAQLGYQQVSEAEDLRTYERSSFSKWFSGRIFVQIVDQEATIASRAATVRALKKLLVNF